MARGKGVFEPGFDRITPFVLHGLTIVLFGLTHASLPMCIDARYVLYGNNDAV